MFPYTSYLLNLELGLLKPDQLPFDHKQVLKRTSAALKMPERTVKRLCAKVKAVGVKSPMKRSGRKHVLIDSFTEGVIRRCVIEMYCSKTYPTLDILHAKLQGD